MSEIQMGERKDFLKKTILEKTDIITILSAITVVPKDQTRFKQRDNYHIQVRADGEEYTWNINLTSLDNLKKGFGIDQPSSSWVGKEVRLFTKYSDIGGREVLSLYGRAIIRAVVPKKPLTK